MDDQALPQLYLDALLGYRHELDALDAKLLTLLAARFAVTRQVGALKAAHGAAAADPAREAAQLECLSALSSGLGLPVALVREVFATVFRFVREGHLAQARSAYHHGVAPSEQAFRADLEISGHALDEVEQPVGGVVSQPIEWERHRP